MKREIQKAREVLAAQPPEFRRVMGSLLKAAMTAQSRADATFILTQEFSPKEVRTRGRQLDKFRRFAFELAEVE